MSLMILIALIGALLWRASAAVWRLWVLLPKRNTDFGLVPADTGGRP